MAKSSKNKMDIIQEIKQQKEKLGIDQYTLTLYRKRGGSYAFLEKNQGVPFEEIFNTEEYTKQKFGGGDYRLDIVDVNMTSPVVSYFFSIEGVERNPEAEQPKVEIRSPFVSNPVGTYWDMKLEPFRQFRRSEDDFWKEKYDTLRQEIQELKDRMAEEKRRLEMELQQKNHQLELQRLQESFEKKISELMAKIDSKPQDNGRTILELTLAHQKEMNQNMLQMMQRDIETQKQFLEKYQNDSKKEIEMWKEYMARIEKLNDPSKTLEVLNAVGQQSANWFNLLAEVAQSGLLDRGGQNIPPWMGALQQGLESVGGLVNKFLDAKTKEISMRQAMLQQGMQPPHVSSPALPAPPPSPKPQPQPQKPSNLGSPEGQLQSAKPQNTINTSGINLNNPIVNHAFNTIFQAIQKKTLPERVAELIFINLDYLTYMRLLPEQFKELTEKKEKFAEFFKSIPIPAESEYIEKIIEEYAKIIEGDSKDVIREYEKMIEDVEDELLKEDEKEEKNEVVKEENSKVQG